jgi:segregation and condensation protein A
MSESPQSTTQAPATPSAPPAPAAVADGHDYKVNLEVYSGPLELLLYLIRRDEVDIKNIPIARITEQYLRHVEIIRKIDINLAGEFLVMAATLMEIKSRMLIPKQPQAAGGGDPNDPNASAPTSVEELADPRYELVKQLLAYKEFKDAATDLKRRAQTESARYPRAMPKPEGRAPLAIEDLDLFRLIDAFNAIMSSLGHSAYGHEVVYDDTPISLHQADILDRLTREPSGALTLQELFQGRTKKSEMIGLFLATLELIRQKKVTISQPETLGPIQIVLRTDHPEQQLFENETPAHEAPAPAEPSAQSDTPPTET